MEKQYINYKTEEFAQDIDFIQWVKVGKKNEQWNDFINKNPEVKERITAARKIVLALKFKNSQEITQEELKVIYERILKSKNREEQKIRRVRFQSILKYAAIFLVVVSIGGAITYLYNNQQQNDYTFSAAPSSSGNDAVLVLPDGNEILLSQKESQLQFNSDQRQVQINQDSIINYNQTKNENAMAQIVIPYGKRSNITLPDGTKVWLNAGSSLIFPQKFNKQKRQVYLKGEAWFEVVKNKTMPFIVKINEIDVTVYGTKFNVSNISKSEDVEVVLVEGSVGIKKSGFKSLLEKEVKLAPNQKALFNSDKNMITVESDIDVSYYTSWKDGLLKFDCENISTVFAKISQYYNVRFIQQDNKLILNSNFSGKLDLKESLDEVLEVLADVAPIEFHIENDNIIVCSKAN